MCNYSISNVNNISASNLYASNLYYHSVLSNIDGVQTDFSVGTNGLYVWDNSGPGAYSFAPVFALYTLSAAFAAGGNSYYLVDGLGSGISGGIQAFAAYNSNVGGPASLYISTLYFGNNGATVNGQLTTDSTAANLYWNGAQINDGVTEIIAGSNISISATVGTGKGNVTINAPFITGTLTITPTGGYTANEFVSVTGLSATSIVMITPMDDLTEGGLTIISYRVLPGTNKFTVFLDTPYNPPGGPGAGSFFDTINNYHSFMYYVVSL
jgi:hypothetical protein